MSHSFHRIGHGPHPVLVLHGWFGDAHAFAPLEPWLSTAEFSYVCMDYRGYGGMRAVAGAYSIEEIALDALALADALGWADFSLVGHSMGGMVAEKIAALAPQRVRALLAVAPVPCGGVRYDAATRRLLEAAATEPALRATIIDRSTGSRLPAAWVQWKATYSLASSSAIAFAAYFHAWADSDFATAQRHDLPVQLLVGAHDPTFNAALMQATYLRRYPQASMQVLADAGHYPMNETPLALVASMEGFLRSAAGAAI